MQKGKWEATEGIELLNQESIKTLCEEEKYKFLVILEGDIIKQEWKEIWYS